MWIVITGSKNPPSQYPTQAEAITRASEAAIRTGYAVIIEGDWYMTAKANQVDVKVDDVLAKVDQAADAAINALEAGTQDLLGALDEAGNFGKNLGSIGRRLRQRLGTQTNNPPVE